MTPSICQLKNRDEFPGWLNVNSLVNEGVEVGVFEGQYSDLLLSKWRGRRLTGIDPFIHYPDEVYHDGANRVDLPEIGKRTAERFAGNDRYDLVVMTSLSAAFRFPDGSLDFVHLDGNHGLEHIRADIKAWWPKVKAGGVFSGHDFYDRDNDAHKCGVATAVLEFIYENKLSAHITPCTSWWVIKP